MEPEQVRIVREEVLADNYYTLKNVTYEQRRGDGSWQRQAREVYLAASGAVILLYDSARRTVLLTRQFRLGARLAGHHGMLVEAAAGMLDDASPEERIRAEAAEELGYRVGRIDKVFELFMSPGSLTERVHFFLAEYRPQDRCGKGGGLADEGEDIEVLELGFDEALEKVGAGEIVDAKTVILLQQLQLRLMAPGA